MIPDALFPSIMKTSGNRWLKAAAALERKFPVHDFLLDIEKMNKEFSYDLYRRS